MKTALSILKDVNFTHNTAAVQGWNLITSEVPDYNVEVIILKMTPI